MAQSKQSNKQVKHSSSTPKKASSSNNNGFAIVSKTTITTLQNSTGVKRVIRETTSAPRKRKATAPAKAQVKQAQKKPQTKK